MTPPGTLTADDLAALADDLADDLDRLPVLAPVMALPVPYDDGQAAAWWQYVGAWLAQGFSPNTRAGYLTDVRAWTAWCDGHGFDPAKVAVPGDHNPPPGSVRRAHLDLWARSCEAEGLSHATVARRLSALASLYRYCADEEWIAANPAVRLKRPRVSQDSTRLHLDREELHRLIAAATADGPRSRALVTLLAVNGLRVSEALTARIDDRGIERKHHVLKITGKGGKRTNVALPPAVVDALDEYQGDRTSGLIFTTSTGAPWARSDVNRVLGRLCRDAGITKRISAHSLRHSCITAALDAGVPLRDVSALARHASVSTTQRYDRARESLDRHASYRVASFLAEVG